MRVHDRDPRPSPAYTRPVTERILVVDDDGTIREVVRRYLEMAGFEVLLAGDGATALEIASVRRPDLVVLDLMLPGSTAGGDATGHVGLSVCRRLRASDGSIPIVMLTALGEEADRILGLQLGADDYVTKPFSPRELVLRIQSVLRRATGAVPASPEAAGALVDGDRKSTRLNSSH